LSITSLIAFIMSPRSRSIRTMAFTDEDRRRLLHRRHRLADLNFHTRKSDNARRPKTLG